MIETILEELERSVTIVRTGANVIPRWRIRCADGGEYAIFTHSDDDHDEQRGRTLWLLSRFMAWKLAISYVMADETWVGSEDAPQEEALICIGGTPSSISATIRRIIRNPTLSFGDVEWLAAEQIGDVYRHLLPEGASQLNFGELALLNSVFGKGGEMQATKIT